MTTLKKPLYFCNECKKVVGHLDDLLFVDEYSLKGFCSEDCIEDFYFPLIKYYEVMESSLRKKLNLLDEAVNQIVDQEMVEEVLATPDEIYRQSNELHETYYNFIKHYSHSSVIVVTSVYRKEASFVFLTTRTSSKALINEFRTGEEVRDWFSSLNEEEAPTGMMSVSEEEFAAGMEEADADEDMIFLQLLESKKSKVLADILIKRKDNDIPFEDYSGYESCFQETLDQPDEVFETRDNEGDKLFHYIKSFSMGTRADESFFYIVICLKRNSDNATTNVYPILALPTIDMEMCQEFRTGTRLTGPLQN